jgi:hypothetical protein
MSEDNHSVSLEMLESQLTYAEDKVSAALLKRAQAAKHLRDAQRANGDPLAMTLISALARLEMLYNGQNQHELLVRWASEFPLDMKLFGLEHIHVSGAEPLKIWDCARAVFGHLIPMTFKADHRDVLAQCIEKDGHAGVLGWITLAGSGQWWPILNETRYHDLRITGSWPIISKEKPYAAIVARGPLANSVRGKTLLIAHDDSHRLEKVCAEIQLPATELSRARSLVLFETSSSISETDPRLKEARRAGLESMRVVGRLPHHPADAANDD